MFAVIRTGGKQHRVAENDRIVVERLAAEPGDLVAFDKVLMLGGEGQEPLVGADIPAEARVFARVLEQTRGPKLIVFKKRRRKNSRRTNGHRQDLTAVRIAAISLDGNPDAAEAEAPVPDATTVPDAVAVEPVMETVAEEALPEPALQE